MLRPLLVVAAQVNVLTLDDALRNAREQQPQLRQAHAGTGAARAASDIARAPLLPQLSAAAAYQLATGNCVPRSGSTCAAAPPASYAPFNFYSANLSASQLIWDFGATLDRWRAARASERWLEEPERATALVVLFTTRTAFFTARAQKALILVARETLANQEKHLAQIEGFVTVGTRPEIDLAQARTDRANAKVQLITAEGNYEAAKAALNQAMGVEGPTDYDVADDTLPPIDGEDLGTDRLLGEAQKARPELASLDEQLRAAELTVAAQKGGYYPALSAGAGLSVGGNTTAAPGLNWTASLNLNWGLFQGLQTRAQVEQAEWNVAGAVAGRDLERQQIRLDVEQARLAVRAAKEAITAADEALVNARERLRLAEGRYQIGVGNAIELGDAQVAQTQAAAQRVQADYNLAAARAQLLKALGRK